MSECLTILSCKSETEAESLGGVGWFVLDPRRAEKCRYVIVYHNAYDKRKPGDPAFHRQPVLLAEIRGTHVDPADGRVCIRASRIAQVQGPRQSNCWRSPVGYADDELVSALQIGEWREIKATTLEEAVADRKQWDARYPRR